MVSLDKLNYTDLLIAFRRLVPFQQAVVVGVIFFVIHGLYYLFIGTGPVEAASTSLYPSLMFLVVYYFTSVFIMKKNVQANSQSKGPKKGLRNK